MKRLWLKLGVLVFWLSWPALWVYLHNSRRTRLLLVCNDEFLVVRGWISAGDWGLPGGGLHKGEEPLAGLLREVSEETGVVIAAAQTELLCRETYNNYGLSFSYDCYVSEIRQKPDIRPQRGEIVDFAWQPVKNPAVRLSQDARVALGKWLSNR